MKKVSVLGQPTTIHNRLRGWELRLWGQKVRNCLTCLYFPLAFFGFFAVFCAVGLVSEQPSSSVAKFLVANGFPAVQINEENFMFTLGVPFVGGFIAIPLIPILLGSLFPYFDPKRLSVAKAALVFFGSQTKPCQFDFDFRRPNSPEFTVEKKGVTTRYRQRWLSISGSARSNLAVECHVTMELTVKRSSRNTQRVDIVDGESFDSSSSSGGTVISKLLERIEIFIKAQDHWELPENLNIAGLTLEKVESAGNFHKVEYVTEEALLDQLTNFNLNHTVLTQEKMAKIVAVLLEPNSKTDTASTP